MRDVSFIILLSNAKTGPRRGQAKVLRVKPEDKTAICDQLVKRGIEFVSPADFYFTKDLTEGIVFPLPTPPAVLLADGDDLTEWLSIIPEEEVLRA